MQAFDPQKTFAVLIGTSSYKDPKFPTLLAAIDNLYRMRTLLSRHLNDFDQRIAYHQDSPRQDILDSLKSVAKKDDIELLIIYFSGHGYISDDDSQYYLVLKNSDPEDHETALSIGRISEILGSRTRVIFIIDACFSEKAFSLFKARSYFIMASSSMNEASQYPIGKQFSALTENLAATIENGIAIQNPHLTLNNIFESVREMLIAGGYPVPRRTETHEAGNIEIFPNNSASKGNVHPEFVAKLFLSITMVASPAVKEQMEIAATMNYNPDVTKLKRILDQSPAFLATFIRRLVTKTDIINEVSYGYYKKIIRFLGLYLLSDITHDSGSKGKLKVPKKYILHPSHSDFLALFKEVNNAKAPLFTAELGNALTELIPLFEKIEVASLQPGGKEIRPLLVDVIAGLSFFVNYDFISVRSVQVRKRFLSPDLFTHDISELKGEEIKDYRPIFKLKKDYLNTSAVLVFKTDSFTNLSPTLDHIKLWPLIIDANAFNNDFNKPDLFVFKGLSGNTTYEYECLGRDDASTRTYPQIDIELPDDIQKEYFKVFEELFA